ncbi:MAG: glycosyltransferase family 4 protein [Phycisphaerae bacterium]|jgi:UDP-glucose:(heptosyl)LPS alpha-1,3-glucosyltransferase
MKVAIVQETVDARRGGAETSTLEMARGLASLGLDVSILCRAAPPDVVDEPRLRVVRLRAGGLSRTLRTFSFLRAVLRQRLREHFDIIHAVTPCLAANVYQPRGGTYHETIERNLALIDSDGLRALKRFASHFNLRRRFLLNMEETLLRKRRHRVFVAALSAYVQRQVIEGYGFPAERTPIVFNGVDIAPLSDEEIGAACVAVRTRLHLEPNTPVVLFAAHNFKLKGLAELIRAWSLPAAGATAGRHLIVAGRDRQGSYRRLASKLGAAETIHFVGADLPIRELYAGADALAHPTWYDPCSRVVLEALSLGLPVVTTRHNGAAEVMQADHHGVVVESAADVPALAAAIDRVLDPGVRAACWADAERLREQVSMARHVRELRQLYTTVVATERQRLRER